MKELLKKKGINIALLLIVVAVIAIIVGMNVQSAQKEKEYNAHIEAAEKYLTELNYEQAIAEYTLALEIEPNAEEVLNGLEKTYLAYADSLADVGEYEQAIQVLNEGYAQTGRESLQEKIAQIQEMQAQAEEEQAQAEAFQSYMQQMYDLMAAEDYEQVWHILKEITKIESFESVLQEGAYLYFPEENDVQTAIGVGIYPVHDWNSSDSQYKYALYYGNFVNGKREGKGISMFSAFAYLFIGEWTNDAPQGYGEVRNFYSGDKMVSGNLANGLWDGTVTVSGYDIGGAYSYQAINGIPEDKTEAYLKLAFEYGSNREWEQDRLKDKDSFVYEFQFQERRNGIVYKSIRNGDTVGIWEFANHDCN